MMTIVRRNAWVAGLLALLVLALAFTKVIQPSYGASGLGGMHIIPIYAAENAEAESVPFLSDRWMELLAAVAEETDRRGMGVDMTLGTGWPYGGPWVGPDEAATRAFFQVYALDAGQRLGEKLACGEQPEAVLKRVMAYAADAVVEEPVTPQRASLRWLTTRAFRSGQTYGLLRLAKGDGRAKVAALSLAKIAVYLAKAGVTLWSPVRWRKAAVRAYLHAGIMAAALGKAPVELYGAVHA